MMVPLRRYATFEGRSAALEFWMYSLFLALGYIAIAVVGGILESALGGGGLLIGSGYVIFFAVNFIPGLALTARRLHDLGLSGHFIWAIYGAMLFFSIFAWMGYLVAMSLPGKKQENAYGPPVYGEDLSQVFN